MLVFRLLSFLVLAVPLALAGVLTWTWGVMELAVGALLLFWGLTELLKQPAKEAPAPVSLAAVWPAMLGFGIAIAWGLAQALPWAPEEWLLPIWATADAALSAPLVASLSLDASVSLAAVLRLVAYGGVFWLALQLGRDRKLAREFLWLFLAVSLAYAAYGLALDFTKTYKVLWFEKTLYRASVTSTFIYRNAYATYVGLGLLVATAILVDLLHGIARDFATAREQRRRLLDALLNWGWFPLIVWCSLMTALILTESRAGLAASLVGLCALLVAVWRSRLIGGATLAKIAGLILVAGAGFFLYSGDFALERFLRVGEEAVHRTRVFLLTRDLILERPWLGFGLDSFADLFKTARDAEIPQLYTKVHSSYLENALDLGIPAALALLVALAWPTWICLKGMSRRRQDAIFPCIGVAATVLVAVHALVDFTLQIPAVTLTYVMLLGLATAQSWSSRETP